MCRCRVWRWCRLTLTGSRRSTPFWTPWLKTGKKEPVFLIIWLFIILICKSICDGNQLQPRCVHITVVMYFIVHILLFNFPLLICTTPPHSTMMHKLKVQRPVCFPPCPGSPPPSRRQPWLTSWSRRRPEERRCWRTGCLYWESHSLSKSPSPSRVTLPEIWSPVSSLKPGYSPIAYYFWTRTSIDIIYTPTLTQTGRINSKGEIMWFSLKHINMRGQSIFYK